MKSSIPSTIQKTLHPRNKHKEGYDFKSLTVTLPELKGFVHQNKFGNESIDFANPDAVRALNKALLKQYYSIDYYEIPKTNLCPPIPGRVDYIHHVADVISQSLVNEKNIRILDIGTGANCIYPILGHQEYGWDFVGTEIDKPAIQTAQKILNNNTSVKEHIEIRLQENKRQIFKGIIQPKEHFDITICNPPFHNSREEATRGTQRKLKNLGQEVASKPVLNFGGQNNELWYEGGELAFITNMIYESVHFKTQCTLFSSLVSKKEHLKPLLNILKKVNASHQIIDMNQGNKVSRILVWKF